MFLKKDTRSAKRSEGEQSFEDIMASIESYQKYFKTQTELHKSRMISLEIKKRVADDFGPILMDFKKLNFKLKHML